MGKDCMHERNREYEERKHEVWSKEYGECSILPW